MESITDWGVYYILVDARQFAKLQYNIHAYKGPPMNKSEQSRWQVSKSKWTRKVRLSFYFYGQISILLGHQLDVSYC